MRLLSAGDNVVDKYLTLGRMFPGGNAVNVAVFAARLGADTAYLGTLGNDDAGRVVLHALAQEGVGTDLVTIAAGPNAYAEIELIDGDRTFVHSDRGVAMFAPHEAHFAAMEAYDVVHTAYSGPLIPHLHRMAERTKVSCDFGVRYTWDAVEGALPALYLAAFSAGERSDSEAKQFAQDAVAAGARHAVVTRGERGAYFASSAGVRHQDADRVVVRDTLGAGDAYIATLLVGLLAGRSEEKVLASAASHAAQVCLSHGAFGYETPLPEPAAASPAAQR